MRSSFRIIWKILNFAMLLPSPGALSGFNLLERGPEVAESGTTTAALFGGNQ